FHFIKSKLIDTLTTYLKELFPYFANIGDAKMVRLAKYSLCCFVSLRLCGYKLLHLASIKQPY
ncbi:MAG: hypothetical protein WKF91_17380, partial [Segetibacter sp.]